MTNRNTKYVELMKAFGKAVRYYRNRLGFSQEALADRAQLDRSYMSQIERGIKNATLNSIWRIATALEVVPSQILKMTEELSNGGEARANEALVRSAPAGGAALAAKAPSKGDPSVLLVDDDVEVCAAMRSLLQDAGFNTREATCGFDAFWIVATEPISAVISDVRMQNGSGLELLSAIQKHHPKIPVMLLSGYDDVSPEDAIRMGAAGILSKPFEPNQFVSLLKTSINTRPIAAGVG